MPGQHMPPQGYPQQGYPPQMQQQPQQQGNWKDQLALPARDERYRTEVRLHPFPLFLVGTCRDRAIKRFRTPRAPARGARAAGTVAPTAAEAAKVSRTTQSIDGSTTAAVRASLGATRTPPRRGPTHDAHA